MILNKYRYLFVDGSYYVNKCNFVIWKNWINSEKKESYTEADVGRLMIYSINKLIKEIDGVDKVFILWDQWGADIKGYYATNILKGAYKDNREWISKEDAEKAAEKPEVSEEEKQSLLDKSVRYEMQTKSKKWIIDNLGGLGIPSIRYYGYEADNLAWIYSSILATSNKVSAFASSDSDWRYLGTSPGTHVYKIGVKGTKSQLITYDEMIKEMPENLIGKISLYDWKSYYDSIEGSHNAMRRTRRDRFDTKVIIQNLVEREDYTGIEDVDLFRLQYSTFKIELFPNFHKIVSEFNDKIKIGRIMSIEEFEKFNKDTGLGISNKYYQEFTDRLDSKLYLS